MKITFNITGSRKQLVEAIGKITGSKPVYQGLPSYAFTIGSLVVAKNGTLTIPDGMDHDLVDHLMERLLDMGYTVPQQDTLTIELPADDFTENAVANLNGLVQARRSLILKALGADNLTIELTDGKLRFPWFNRILTPEEAKAYTHFLTALADLAKKQKRVLVRERQVPSDKFAVRCFIIRLGFIGDAYKAERKTLLSRLSGSSAYAKIST